MTSYFASIIEKMGPIQIMTNDLTIQLRDIDKESREIILDLDKEENAILQEVKIAIKNGDLGYDEKAANEKIAAITKKRQESIDLGQEQVKKAKLLYEQLDKCISKLDFEIKSFGEKYNEKASSKVELNQGTGRGRKKKDKVNQVNLHNPFIIMSDPQEEVDPNEPIYCFCRRIGFGKMTSCDGDCDEWYHNVCVGLPEDDSNDGKIWYCPNCSKNHKVEK